MADRIKKIKYCYMKVPNRAGQGERVLATLREEGIDLLAYSGFPAGKGKSQLDFISEDMTALRRVARANDWKLSAVKKGFLITGRVDWVPSTDTSHDLPTLVSTLRRRTQSQQD